MQKAQYQDEATRQLRADLQAQRDRHRRLEADWQRRLDDTKELFHQDLQTINEKHKQAEFMLTDAKDQVRDSIQDALARERAKMDEMHKADLFQKEKQHLANLAEQKKLLEQETRHLEEQLAHQTELRAVLDKLQQRTAGISEIVQSNLKQREEELRKRE